MLTLRKIVNKSILTSFLTALACILLLISPVTLAEDLQSECGHKGGEVEPFSFDICPEDAGVKVLFGVMPNLYGKAVGNFGLDYAGGILDVNKPDAADEIASLPEMASREITELTIVLAVGMGIFSLWVFSFSHLKKISGSSGKKEFDIDYSTTLTFTIFAALLLVPLDGFYVYQWIVAGLSLLALAFFNFFTSTLLYYYSQLIVPVNVDVWNTEDDFVYESEVFVSSDIQFGLCVAQAVNQNTAEAGSGFFNRAPNLDDMEASLSDDDRVSVMEVSGDGLYRKVKIGVGVGELDTSDWSIIDRVMNAIFEKAPIVCGEEVHDAISLDVMTEQMENDAISSFRAVGTDFDKLDQSFQKWYDKHVLAMGLDKTQISEVVYAYFKMFVISQRDPISSTFKLKTYLKSIELAEITRKYSCLVDYRSIQHTDSSIGCDTYISLTPSSETPQMMSSPIKLVPDDLDDPEVLELIPQVEADFFAKRDELREMYSSLLSSTASSYRAAMKYAVESSDRVDRISRIRHEGFVKYLGDFFSLSTLVSERVMFANSTQDLIPKVEVPNFNKYSLLQEMDDMYVGEMHVPSKPNDTISSKQPNPEFVNSLLNEAGSVPTEELLEMKSVQQIDKYFTDIGDSFGAITKVAKMGVTSELYQGVNFGEGVAKKDYSSFFVNKCFAGDHDQFTEDMMDTCALLMTHPFYVLRELGQALFLGGSGFLTLAVGAGAKAVAASKVKDAARKNKPKIPTHYGAIGARSVQTTTNAERAGGFVAGMMSAVAPLFFMIGFLFTVVGFVLAVALPLLPIVSAMLVMVNWFVLVIVSLVFGSMFIPFMISIRKKSKGGQGLVSGGFQKTYVHILLKPLVVSVAVVIIWVVLDVAVKTSLFIMQFIYSGIEQRVSVDLLMSLLPALYVLFSMYILMKVFGKIATMTGGISDKVLEFADSGSSKAATGLGQTAANLISANLISKGVSGSSEVRENSKSMIEGVEVRRRNRDRADRRDKLLEEELLRGEPRANNGLPEEVSKPDESTDKQ